MPDLGPLEEAPAYMIYRLSRLLRHSLKKTLKSGDLDVTTEQYFLLYRLFQQDGVLQAALADRLLEDYPNITRHIDSLEKKGLVERRSDEADRRKYLIFLTDAGRGQMERAVPLIESERARLFGDFTKSDLATFKQLLLKVQGRLV